MNVGDRVRMRYGLGTVVSIHRGSVMVRADIGQGWLCDVGDVLAVGVQGPLDNWFHRKYLTAVAA